MTGNVMNLGRLLSDTARRLPDKPALFADIRHYHADLGAWDLCNSGEHATFFAARSWTAPKNLREIEFPVISNADQVFVTEPVLVVNNTPVAGVRLRGWKSDNTPFQFNAAHNVPVKLFLEGIEASTSIIPPPAR